MRENFYDAAGANFPRLSTDRFFDDYENAYNYDNFLNKAFDFVEDFQLLKPELWRRFVQQFRWSRCRLEMRILGKNDARSLLCLSLHKK